MKKETRELLGGVQHTYTFNNGYGASVVQHDFSYGGRDGLWELGVLHNGHLDYTTSITNDVIGHLTQEQVDNLLTQIEQLPPKQPE